MGRTEPGFLGSVQKGGCSTPAAPTYPGKAPPTAGSCTWTSDSPSQIQPLTSPKKPKLQAELCDFLCCLGGGPGALGQSCAFQVPPVAECCEPGESSSTSGCREGRGCVWSLEGAGRQVEILVPLQVARTNFSGASVMLQSNRFPYLGRLVGKSCSLQIQHFKGSTGGHSDSEHPCYLVTWRRSKPGLSAVPAFAHTPPLPSWGWGCHGNTPGPSPPWRGAPFPVGKRGGKRPAAAPGREARPGLLLTTLQQSWRELVSMATHASLSSSSSLLREKGRGEQGDAWLLPS